MAGRRLAVAGLPVVAITAFAVVVGGVLAAGAAAGTLGYDFLAYHIAARRLLEGGPLYDLTYTAAGGFGLFYYPPTFVLLALPFAGLDPTIASWLWSGGLVVAILAGIALLPVSATVRWGVLLLAALDWPVSYAIRLGQVGPLLFLAFAAGWRWLDRPAVLGATGAIGAAIKIQPGLVLAWAVATGRWRAVAVGAALLVALAAAATVVVGPGAWFDYRTLLARVSDAITTPQNLAPAAVAFRSGLSAGSAAILQWITWAVVLVAVGVGIARTSSVASYLSVVVASQLLSPVLWDHYAMLLLLPVAWLLSRGRTWAAAIPLATSIPLVLFEPAAIYPIAFGVTLAAVIWVGRRLDGAPAVAHLAGTEAAPDLAAPAP